MFASAHPNMLRVFAISGLFSAASTAALASPPASSPASSSPANKTQVVENYGKLPLSFEANQGQADPRIKFLSRGGGYSLFLTNSGAVLALSNAEGPKHQPNQPLGATPLRKTDVVRMELAGASHQMHVTGADQLPGTANYFIGNDRAMWHTSLPTYAKIRYSSVYPGVDLVYYGNQRQLEFDFVIGPDASPNQIQLRLAGAKKLKLTADGELTISAGSGVIAFRKPVVYQIKDGQRQPVEGQFSLLAKNRIGFALGAYDHARPLVVDPVLVYSTYLGGSGGVGSCGLCVGDQGFGVAVDGSGNAFVTGVAMSANFPVTKGAFQGANNASSNGVPNAFIAKINPTGSALIYSSYLGGNGLFGAESGLPGDAGFSIGVDSTGDAYVTGLTSSADFPVTKDAFQTVNNGAANHISNAFVTKLNPTGSALLYSTYLGGSGNSGGLRGDSGLGIAVDGSGDAYVTGEASSHDFPVTKGAFQTTLKDDAQNAFVTKINPSGTALLYSTYLGGKRFDFGSAIAVNSSGDAYVTGSTSSIDFPVTKNAFQTENSSFDGLFVFSNGFVTKLNPSGSALLYSTYLGGGASPCIGGYGKGMFGGLGDEAFSIAVDRSGDAYVTGQACSPNFPVTRGAFQAVNKAFSNRGSNAFITKLNPAGTALLYSTYLGGSGRTQNGGDLFGDLGSAIAVDSSGNAYVTGTTNSSDFPVTAGAFQGVNKAPFFNAFLAKLEPTGAALSYSTYLGGSGGDSGASIAVDTSGGVYLTGQADSPNFPVTADAFQTKINSFANSYQSNAFVTKLAMDTEMQPTITALSTSANPQRQGGTVTFTAEVSPNIGTAVPTGTVVFSVDGKAAATVSLSSPAKASYSASNLATGKHNILARFEGSTSFAPSVSSLTETITEAQATPPIFSPAVGTYDTSQSVTLTDAAEGAVIHYTTNKTTPSTSSTKYTTAIKVSETTTIEAIAVVTGHFNSSVASATYTILKPQTITFTPVTGQPAYGMMPIILAAKATSGLTIKFSLVSGPAIVSGTTLTITGAGTVVVAANQAGNATYAPAPQVTQTIIIEKAALTATAANKSMTYGAAVPVLTYTLTGFVNNDTQSSATTGAPALSTTATAKSHTDTYPIAIKTGTLAARNYTFKLSPGTLTVTKAKLTVTATNLTMKQGAKVPTLAWTMTGFVNGDTRNSSTVGWPALTTTATSKSTPGTYPITIKAGTLAAGNYSFSTVNGTLTVTK
jgi:hypothetical protein